MALPADQLSRVPLLKTPRHVTCGEPGSIYRHQRGLNPKAGLITRGTADDDRRSIEIAVIDDGRAALLAAIESHLQLVATLFSDRLTATDQAALSWVLSKLLAGTKPDCDAS